MEGKDIDAAVLNILKNNGGYMTVDEIFAAIDGDITEADFKKRLKPLEMFGRIGLEKGSNPVRYKFIKFF